MVVSLNRFLRTVLGQRVGSLRSASHLPAPGFDPAPQLVARGAHSERWLRPHAASSARARLERGRLVPARNLGQPEARCCSVSAKGVGLRVAGARCATVPAIAAQQFVQAELASLHQTHGRKSLPCVWLHYASRLNSGVMPGRGNALSWVAATAGFSPSAALPHSTARFGLHQVRRLAPCVLFLSAGRRSHRVGPWRSVGGARGWVLGLRRAAFSASGRLLSTPLAVQAAPGRCPPPGCLRPLRPAAPLDYLGA